MQLNTLNVGWNVFIQDIRPLANLTQLKKLYLNNNRIVDVSPLADLTLLEELRIDNNRITDHGPLNALSISRFFFDESVNYQRFQFENGCKIGDFLLFFKHGTIS